MRCIMLIIMAALLSACQSNFKQPKTNELGYLPVNNSADVQVTVNRGVNTEQFRKTLYVSTDMHGAIDWYAYQDYIMEAFRQLDFFDDVITRPPTLYVNTTPPKPTKVISKDKFWFDMTDPVSYPNISKNYGPNVMVAKAILRNRTDELGTLNAYTFQLQLVDPKTGHVLFQSSSFGTSRNGIDTTIINPVLNYAKGYLVYNDPTYKLRTLQSASDAKYDLNAVSQWWHDMNETAGWSGASND